MKSISYILKLFLIILFRGILLIFSYLPMNIIVKVSKFLELILYKFSKLSAKSIIAKKYHVARVNLKLCFPELSDKERELLLRDNFHEAIIAILHYGFVFDRNKQDVLKKVQVCGDDIISKYYGKKPIIAFAPHFWGLDLGAIRLSIFFTAVSMMHDDHNSPLRALLKKSRMRFMKSRNGIVIGRQDGIKQVILKLKSEKICFYYLPDIDLGGKHSSYEQFFAHGAYTLNTLEKISKLADAVVVPIKTIREGSFYKVCIGDVIQQDDLKSSNINKLIENMVLKDKSQYMWDLKRFGSQPDLPYGKLYET